MVVTTPSREELDIRDARLLAEMESLAEELVVQLWRHAVDSMWTSMISKASISSVAGIVGRNLVEPRFGANVVVATTGDGRDYPEHRRVGCTLDVGQDGTAVRVDRSTQRCTVLDLDPTTGAADVEVFSVVRDHRRNKFGVYASVARPKVVHVGDPLTVRS